MHKREVRDSVINELLEKVEKHNYGKYLKKIRLNKIRGFCGEIVSLDFPVTALIGPNGGGKTTVLGAAACAYKSIRPRQFFAKIGKFDDSMQNWQIEYELIDRKENKSDITQRTATFKNYRWNREALDRKVSVFGVSRTIPPSEWAGLSNWATSSLEVPDDRIEGLSSPVIEAVGKILGKDVSGFNEAKIDQEGRVTLLSGSTQNGETYSEFHFGAGESSVIRMVMAIESSQEQSLILIEEIENGLHPVATIRMVEYLIDMAYRKKSQVIFTTHSDDALVPLPSKAIWATMGDTAFQGKLEINALRAIKGQIDANLGIFVEDTFAKLWIEACVRASDIPIEQIEVHPMQGDSVAANINEYHNMDPSASHFSICFIDGDSSVAENPGKRVYRLPGESPESYIFDCVLDEFDNFGGKLAVTLLQPYEDTEKVRSILHSVRLTNHDPHLLFSQVGDKLGFLPELTVKNAFAAIWAQAYPIKSKMIVDYIKNNMPE